MIISEKQILKLIEICRLYWVVSDKNNWEYHTEVCESLLREIQEQQSEELHDIK